MSPANPVPGRPVTFTLGGAQRRPVDRDRRDRHRPARHRAERRHAPRPPRAPAPWTATTCSAAPWAPWRPARRPRSPSPRPWPPSFTGTLSNTATTSTATTEPNTTNNSATATGSRRPVGRRVDRQDHVADRADPGQRHQLHPHGAQRRALDGGVGGRHRPAQRRHLGRHRHGGQRQPTCTLSHRQPADLPDRQPRARAAPSR